MIERISEVVLIPRAVVDDSHMAVNLGFIRDGNPKSIDHNNGQVRCQRQRARNFRQHVINIPRFSGSRSHKVIKNHHTGKVVVAQPAEIKNKVGPFTGHRRHQYFLGCRIVVVFKLQHHIPAGRRSQYLNPVPRVLIKIHRSVKIADHKVI